MELTLQQLLFPRLGLCDCESLYFRAPAECISIANDKTITLPVSQVVSFNTYFNSLSICKWRKYTEVQDAFLELDIQGKLLVRVFSAKQINGTTKTQLIEERMIDAPERDRLIVPFSAERLAQVVYFSLQSISGEGMFYGGAFKAEVDEKAVRDVHIGVAICTFRREEHIAHNIEELHENIIDNPESPLYDKLDLFISDNAKTLPEDLASEHVRVFPNRNLGGAGGFTRAMIEMMKVRDQLGITHILMMDDDVKIGYETLERTCAFVCVLKQEYSGAFIGGHMLKLNTMYVQSEAAGFFRQVNHSPVKRDYNLGDFHWVVRDEIEDPVNFLSWWYCCMPMDVVSETNLPLPIFIKRDDIEYSLRNGTDFVTINGVCVWHEEFYFKTSSYLYYYYIRNLLIMLAKHRPKVKAQTVWDYVEDTVTEKINTYRYKEAELMLLGVQHFLEGIEWLKAQDGERLHELVMVLGYQKQPVDQLDWSFFYGTFTKTLEKKEEKNARRVRWLTHNGMVLPTKRDVVVNMYQPKASLFYRVRRALNYEDYTKTGYITYRDHDAYRILHSLLKKVRKQFMTRYKEVAGEYAARYSEITSLEFWNHYLFEEGEVPSYKSVLPVMRPPSTRGQLVKQYKAAFERGCEQMAFWVPIEQNKVVFAVQKRHGFTCNPKYVIKKLRELYGDALELHWVTDYPDSDAELQELGVPIVKSDSDEHRRLQQQARVYVTNDSFPAWAAKRNGQIWINTWHGAIAYKHIGYDYIVPKSKAANELYSQENREADHFIAGCELFAKDTAVSFGYKPETFLRVGLPRNDVFFAENNEIKDKVRTRYHVPEGVSIAMFAPTFRRGMNSSTYGLDIKLFLDSLRERFGGEWVLFFRNHSFVSKGKLLAEADVIDVSDYPDMNELLYATDVLLSDYSSCLYDFALLKRPSFVFGSDIESYIKNDRGFAIPIEEWPYPIAFTNEGLAENIRAFDEEVYRGKLEEHLTSVGCYDKGTASERVARLIGAYCGLENTGESSSQEG